MLKKILSISGKPGLFQLISQGRNMIIVESLTKGIRQPAYSNDKIVSLGDIAIFTEEGEEPLSAVFASMKKKENGGKASIDPKSDPANLREYLAEVLPEFDRDRVYPSDIKKLISWYNLLVEKGFTDFEESEKESVE